MLDHDEFEEELRRNDMLPKPVKVGAAEIAFRRQREAHLGVSPNAKPPVHWDHPPEDAFQHPDEAYSEPEYFVSGELYSAPNTPRTDLPKGVEEAITQELVNVLATVDLLNQKPEAKRDMVTLPEHYARFKIEPVRFSVENNLNFFQANIVKYILRYDAKNGMEDLRKAQRYLNMFIKWVDGDPDWWKK